jgi:hypothetical protein
MSLARRTPPLSLPASCSEPKTSIPPGLSAGFDGKGEGRRVYRPSDADGGIEGKWRATAAGVEVTQE